MKQTKADTLRGWGLDPRKIRLRYNTPIEKGIYWYYLSLHVRQRDVEQYGTCISCGREINMENCDAGHFMPAENCGRDLLFDLTNVNAECKGCNGFDTTHLLGYAEGLDKRYGNGTAKELRERRDRYRLGRDGVVKDWKRHEYAEKIKALPTYTQAVHTDAQ